MADASMYVLNPFFQTKSFDEMVKPLTMYAQAYKEQEAKIEDMTDKAAALEWIANQNPDSQTAALYRDMSDKIKGLRDDIMTNGLTGGLSSRILGARRMYSANSAEITRRYEDMKKYQDRMEQLKDKDNSMIFSPESQNVTLDDFAGGKRPQIKAISGNEVMARGAAIGKRLTSQIFGDGVEGTVAGEQFWKFYQENGMTDEALWAWLHTNNMDDKYKMVKEVIDGVYNSFKGFSPEDQLELKSKFIEGIYSGAVYNKQVSYQPNGEYLSAAQREDIRLKNEQLKLSQEESARQNLALRLQGLSAGYDIDIENNTINKNLKEPDRRVIKHDDGSATIIDIPYNEDGTQDTKKIRSINVDKNGNVTSVTIGDNAVSDNPQNNNPVGWGVNRPSPQGESVVTSTQQDAAKNSGDKDSYVTVTNRDGSVSLQKVTGKDKTEGSMYSWFNSPDSYTLDWSGDVNGKLDKGAMRSKQKGWFNLTKGNNTDRYRKWIKINANNMSPELNAQYQKALNKFVSTATDDSAHNISNYEVYYTMDPEHPNKPKEFLFKSNIESEPFNTVQDDNEALAIMNVEKVVKEAKKIHGQDYEPRKETIDTAYEMGLQGKVAKYKSDTSGASSSSQKKETVTQQKTTKKQQSQADSLKSVIVSGTDLEFKKN